MNAYAAPLRLEPRRSRWLGRWLLLAHLACLPVLALPALDAVTRLLLLLALCTSLLLYWRQQVTRTSPGSIRALTLGEGRQLLVEFRDGSVLAATLAPQAVVLPWLVILNVQLPGWRRRSVLVLPDTLPTDSFRRLRVRLRLVLEQLPA